MAFGTIVRGGLLLFATGAVLASSVYKGLEITVKGVERAANVSLQDCPPGENSVRGVIRPVEQNEFVTIAIDVKVLPSFAPVQFPKPVLYDAADKPYKTAQSFGDMRASASYSCAFSFRVPKGTKVSRFTIEDASLDVSALEK
jgi:hypothetical protein